MEKNSAGSPLDQTIEQYKRDLMAVYRRSRTPVSPADQPPAPKPARPRPADPPAAKPALAEMPLGMGHVEGFVFLQRLGVVLVQKFNHGRCLSFSKGLWPAKAPTAA